MLFAFTSCGGNESQTTQQPNPNHTLEFEDNQVEQGAVHSDIGTPHQFDDLGFSFILPSSWEGKYNISRYDFENDYGIVSSVRVHHTATQDELVELDFAGMLFWINRFPSVDGMENEPIGLILAQAEGYTYAINYPQDSEHEYYSVSVAAVQFREMMEYLEPINDNFIVNSFSLLEPAEQSARMNNEGVFRQFDNLGFSIVFPAFWDSKYGAVEFYVEYDGDIEHRVEIYHIATREELYALYGFGYGGNILTFGRAVGEHYTYDNAPIMAGGTIFLAQTGGYTYFVNFPSGVEHNEDPNSEAGAEYLEMVGHWEPSHWDFLINSFQFIDE